MANSDTPVPPSKPRDSGDSSKTRLPGAPPAMPDALGMIDGPKPGIASPALPPPVEATAPSAPNLPAEPVAGEETVTLTIDGEPIEVRKGTNVLEAAKIAGKDICHFCYHPGLTIAASCRQCLVEIEKFPKLQPSCQVPVGEGMVVHTESPAVRKARQEMLEFTLKNHPIDCPICDKAGECTLQRHYMDHDHSYTRVDVEKIRKPKHRDIGRDIVLDAERCILCSRCVRFCEEIPGTAELTMAWRGDREEIDIAHGHRLDNAYSVNVVDICPVGALTSKDFRFKIRAWELAATATTCPGCATGCAVELHSKHERAYRLVPRHDPSVNGHWMCDDGRLVYKQLEPDQRVLRPRVDGETVPLVHAIQIAARRLEGSDAGGPKTAVVFSAQATNEANEALAALADMLDAERFVLGRPHGPGDDILIDSDKNPNTRGAHLAAGSITKHEAELALELAGGAYEAVLFVDGTGELGEVALAGLRSITSICLADAHSPLSDACAIVLPAASWAEVLGTFINRQGRLRVISPAWRAEGERRHRADILRDLVLALGGRDIGSARERTHAIARRHEHVELLEMLDEDTTMRPTLLRFGHSRG
jgi:NADH-quinone oxidoreductase subunit G